MMNAHDLSVMHENLFRMCRDLYSDDNECEGNQALAHQIFLAMQIIEAELSLQEAFA
jgi:hypothetical protein